MLVAGFAVFIMLTGVGVVGGTYYVDSVPDRASCVARRPRRSTTATARPRWRSSASETRYPLKFEEMNNAVKEAIVASEDKTFWTNEGVDFKGVMRAAWNNFTGGQTQGASTITQQYARVAFDLQGATYSRKLREAVLAWKIDDSSSKEKILEYYLNSVPVRPAGLRHRGGRPGVLRQDGEESPPRRNSRSPPPRRWCWPGHGQAARARPGRPGGLARLRPDPQSRRPTGSCRKRPVGLRQGAAWWSCSYLSPDRGRRP